MIFHNFNKLNPLLNHFVNKNQKVKPNKLEKQKSKEETMGLVVQTSHGWVLDPPHNKEPKQNNRKNKLKVTNKLSSLFLGLNICSRNLMFFSFLIL